MAMKLYPHHESTIENIRKEFISDDNVLAILVGGSIAHGYARKNSDVDIVFILTDKEYDRRKSDDNLLYFNRELCTYPDGYVDGKCVNLDYLRLVNEKGNEPTRYAFKDVFFIFCKDDSIKKLIERIPVFSDSAREDHARRFFAQLTAWKWFLSEGKKHKNRYLENLAVSNFVMYSCRLILNHNRLLYPFQKWLLKETEKAEHKPEKFMANIQKLLKNRNAKLMDKIYADLKNMKLCDFDETKWGTFFHKDIETTWMQHDPYIADL